jgi:two-component system, NarL family, sensor histidine kinase DesK
MNRVPAAHRVPVFLRPAPDSIYMQEARRDRDPRYQMLHALWSFWVFMTPLFQPVDAGYWWSLVISYPVFLMLFVLVHVRPAAEHRLYVMALTVLAAVSLKWNPSAWTYAVFACVYVPYRGSVVAGLASMALIELPLVVEAVLFKWPLWVIVLMIAVCFSSGAGALFGHIAQLRDAELRLSQDEVRRLAATAERERIGRDLHDLLGHTLSLITLKLELSRKLFDKDRDASRRELEDAERVARHALAEVRAAVTGIRAARRRDPCRTVCARAPASG